MKVFDSMVDLPTTDEEAKEALFYGQDPLFASIGYGFYRIFRERDNDSVIRAYERALLKMLGKKDLAE